MPHKPQQNPFVVPVLKIFSTKLPVHLLCTIINTSPNGIILPKTQHIGEMKLLSNSDDTWHPPSVNEVTHDISSNHIDAQYPETDSYTLTSCKINSICQTIQETSVLIPSNLQIHTQIPLSNAKVAKQTKYGFYKLLQKYDAII